MSLKNTNCHRPLRATMPTFSLNSHYLFFQKKKKDKAEKKVITYDIPTPPGEKKGSKICFNRSS